MLNIYKNRAIFFLFGIILVINTILSLLVFFAYSSIIRKDYSEKLTSVASQTATNASLILSFFEEEIEIFINKNNVEESLDSIKFGATNFIRTDSTSFESLLIFRGTDYVYASNAETVDFYRDMILKSSSLITDRRWLLSEDKDKIISTTGIMVYVRTLYDTDTGKQSGFVVASVSQSQLTRLLNLDKNHNGPDKGEFLPQSLGICVDDKILFLGKSAGIVSVADNLPTASKEICLKKTLGNKDFFVIYDTGIIESKTFIMLVLLIILYVVVVFFSFRILKFMVNEICVRIYNLNCKMELYSPPGEEKSR